MQMHKLEHMACVHHRSRNERRFHQKIKINGVDGQGPAHLRGGAEAVDEQYGRALPTEEVVHTHPSPRPGGAAPAQVLQRQRLQGNLAASAADATLPRPPRPPHVHSVLRAPYGRERRSREASVINNSFVSGARHQVSGARHQVSGTTIRGAQIIMKTHPASQFKGKDQQRRDGLNSPLLDLQQDA
jgi:hypothetical protein